MQNNLVDFIKKEKSKRLEFIGEGLEKIVNYYYIKEKLDLESNNNKTSKVKKNKNIKKINREY